MKPEKYFKHIRRFWFQDREGYRYTADECCSVGGLPAEVKMKTLTDQINNGLPIERSRVFICAECGKQLQEVK
jgi:hypothetical protein